MSIVLTSSDNLHADNLSVGQKLDSTIDRVPDVVITDAHGESMDNIHGDRGHYVGQIPGLADLQNPVTLTIVCIASVVGVLVCMIALLWIRTKRRQKLSTDTPFPGESKTTNSAPVSRIASPKLSKQKSCPDSLSAVTCRHNLVVSSMKPGCIPEITVTAEHVQPGSPYHTNEAELICGIHQSRDQAKLNKFNACHSYSFPEDNEPQFQEIPRGRLWFSVVYDGVAEKLGITLIKVEGLSGRNNTSQPRDPYVKIFLLPDEKTCRMSKVKKKTLNPVFNETHTFQVTVEAVKKSALRFSVYDVDTRRVRHSLGHVVISLKDLDLTRDDVIQAKLESMIRAAASEGELQMSLLYTPSYTTLVITIHNVRNLLSLEDYPDMGVYVRVQLFYGHMCRRVKHTKVHQGGAEITFNETLTFTVSGRLLETCNVRVSVMFTPTNIRAANETEHGRVTVGPFMFARGSELAHWQEMLSKPELSSTRWHSLTSTTS